jgi:putative hydrolase of HD superfamily
MDAIADLLFEARILKAIPRSGYHFLGTGTESVAEHTYMMAFIAMIMAQIEPEADMRRLTQMCLIHDLPEARIGDLNTVQKKYVTADEKKAFQDAVGDLDFGEDLIGLMDEFNDGNSLEAQLARDADQLSFIIDLKAQNDLGRPAPVEWIPAIRERLQTDVGKRLAEALMNRAQDAWWRKK